MRRALVHFWRSHLAVTLAVTVCGAVLTGALLVGDSVRGSLRDLTLDRLGRIDVALLGERFFRQDLPADLLAQEDFGARFNEAVGAILLRGNAVHGSSRARASRVNVIGVDDAVLAMISDSDASAVFRDSAGDVATSMIFDEGGVFPPVVLNQALAEALGAAAGDQVLIRFQLGADVPRDSLLGDRSTEEVIGTLRGTVQTIVPNRGIGSDDHYEGRNDDPEPVLLEELPDGNGDRDLLAGEFRTRAGLLLHGILPELIEVFAVWVRHDGFYQKSV